MSQKFVDHEKTTHELQFYIGLEKSEFKVPDQQKP